MTNTSPRQAASSQPSAIGELIAIRQELELLRKEVKILQNGLIDKVAKGFVIASVILVVLWAVLFILVSVAMR